MTAMPNAFRTDTEHNVYFTASNPGLPAGDPRRIRVRSAKGGLAYDQIPAGSPLRVAYESDELTACVTPVTGSRPRISAVLSYASAPHTQLSDYTKQLFYGRAT
jgi:hypothetical protein